MSYNKEYYEKNKEMFKRISKKWYYKNHEENKKIMRLKSRARTNLFKMNRMMVFEKIHKKTNILTIKLLSLRKKTGLSQKELAKLLNITQPAYWKYEKGKICKDKLIETIQHLERKLS